MLCIFLQIVSHFFLDMSRRSPLLKESQFLGVGELASLTVERPLAPQQNAAASFHIRGQVKYQASYLTVCSEHPGETLRLNTQSEHSERTPGLNRP